MKLDGEKLLADLYLERDELLGRSKEKQANCEGLSALACLDKAMILGDVVLRIEQGDYTIKDKG